MALQVNGEINEDDLFKEEPMPEMEELKLTDEELFNLIQKLKEDKKKKKIINKNNVIVNDDKEYIVKFMNNDEVIETVIINHRIIECFPIILNMIESVGMDNIPVVEQNGKSYYDCLKLNLEKKTIVNNVEVSDGGYTVESFKKIIQVIEYCFANSIELHVLIYDDIIFNDGSLCKNDDEKAELEKKKTEYEKYFNTYYENEAKLIDIIIPHVRESNPDCNMEIDTKDEKLIEMDKHYQITIDAANLLYYLYNTETNNFVQYVFHKSIAMYLDRTGTDKLRHQNGTTDVLTEEQIKKYTKFFEEYL